MLTTDSEFHSFTRQIARLEEDRLVVAERVATEPFESFRARFAAAAGTRSRSRLRQPGVLQFGRDRRRLDALVAAVATTTR